MRVHDSFHERHVGRQAETLIVDHDIEVFRPVGIGVNAGVMLAVRAFVKDRPGDIGAGADAFGNNCFLRLVIVAAAASDEQGAKRLGSVQPGADHQARDNDANVAREGCGIFHGFG